MQLSSVAFELRPCSDKDVPLRDVGEVALSILLHARLVKVEAVFYYLRAVCVCVRRAGLTCVWRGGRRRASEGEAPSVVAARARVK
jgi:hypothetical protein